MTHGGALVLAGRKSPESARELVVNRVTESLTHRFPGARRSHVTAIVREEYDLLDGHPIRTYVPNLVEHESRERLRHAG